MHNGGVDHRLDDGGALDALTTWSFLLSANLSKEASRYLYLNPLTSHVGKFRQTTSFNEFLNRGRHSAWQVHSSCVNILAVLKPVSRTCDNIHTP